MLELSIGRDFCGPPRSGNGGYTAGLLANAMKTTEPVVVTLLAPPPLDTPLHVAVVEEGIELRDGAVVVASASVCDKLNLAIPAAVTFEEAKDARSRFIGRHHHAIPGCFVCGTENPSGLRIHAGEVPGKNVVTADWVPSENHIDPEGLVSSAIGWAALDCPGYFGAFVNETPVFALLGRMSVETFRWPALGEKCVVMGWLNRKRGRKIQVASALCTADGEVLASSKATWVTVDSKKYL